MVNVAHNRAFDVPDDDSEFERVAAEVMPEGESRVWNNAIMDLGCGLSEDAPV